MPDMRQIMRMFLIAPRRYAPCTFRCTTRGGKHRQIGAPMSKQSASIHDAFFKKVMSDPQIAGQFLRERLPREVAVLLSSEAPELLPGSFVSEELAQDHSDLLFRLRLNEAGSEDVFAYLLVEHKSNPDPLARLQVLRYVTRVLVKWYGEHKRLPLPMVLPLLAHHGPEGWTISTQFADLFGRVPEPLRPYLVSFRHVLVDLARIEDDALSRHVRLRAFLKALKYIQRSDLAERIDILLADSAELESVDVVLLLTYIGKGRLSVNNETVRAALHRWVPSREEEIMASFGQEYFESGKAAGVAEGLQQGRASSLIELLETRFGRVPAPLQERIYGADAASMDVWLKRVISAPDLSSVFGPSSRGG
jgi:predicted transposase/invertase (TIGR01784 family)